jgi:hypothetical protein
MWHTLERGQTCTGFGGKARRNKTTGKQRRRWEDGIKMDLREIDWEVVVCIHLTQDRSRLRALVNVVMKLRVLAPRS